MNSRLLRNLWIRNRKNALNIAEKGVLRKDDSFEVVFNPGSDKREKRILGQVSPLGRDTGGVRTAPCTSKRPTQLPKSIEFSRSGQIARLLVPVAKGLRCGDANRRRR